MGNAREVPICLIIAVRPGRSLPPETLEAAINSAVRFNPDGMGVAWPDDGKVRTLKHKSNYAPVKEQVMALYRATDLPMLIHLRYNTVGSNTNVNTHPFVLSPTLAMAHNKTLRIQPPNINWSDSRTVAELLKVMLAGDPEFFSSELFYSFIEDQAGHDNRFAFLDAEQEDLLLINEHLGVEVDGIWFSNLYAWNPRTAGLSTRSTSFTSRFNDQDYSQWDDCDVDDHRRGDPLDWRFARMDR